VADEGRPGPGETGDATRAAEPGAITRLLLEIAQAPEEDLAASWREPLEPGDVVGRYEIRREVGRGGFGAVYEAFDPQLGRTVALKALKPGRSRHPVSEEWIQKEAEAVAKLDHPAIVTIFDVGTCPAGAYLVMELLRGETLAKRIETNLSRLGFPPEKRGFHAHVTIGRLRETRPVREVVLPLSEQMFGDTRVDALTLFESDTKSSGSVYSELRRIDFKTPRSGSISEVQRQTPAVQLDPTTRSNESAAVGDTETDDGWPRGHHHDDL